MRSLSNGTITVMRHRKGCIKVRPETTTCTLAVTFAARMPAVCPAHHEAATEHVNKAVGCATKHADKPASPSRAMYAGRNTDRSWEHSTSHNRNLARLALGLPLSSPFMALAFSGGRQSCHGGTADTRARPQMICVYNSTTA